MKLIDRLNALTAEQLKDARSWISECQWSDIEDDGDLSDLDVVRGIARHYDGGWAQFLRDSIPV